MKILALIGSPRRRGNTVTIIDALLKGAQHHDHDIEKIALYDTNILPCIDCRKCQKDPYACCLKDDMEEVYVKLLAADIIIFGTPLYWYGPSAPMKACMDRLRPFVSSRGLDGKKALVVVPSEEGPDACGPITAMFERSFVYLGIQHIDNILVTAYDVGDVEKSPQVLTDAYNAGAAL